MACSSTPKSDYTRIGKTVYSEKPADFIIDVFLGNEKPNRAFEKIAILEARKPTFGIKKGNLDDVKSELMTQARAVGADAIINIQERQSKELENSKFFVTGIAIKYIN